MPHQASVTSYYKRKRKRNDAYFSKRMKLNNENKISLEASTESVSSKPCKPQNIYQMLESKKKLQDLQETLTKIKQLKEKSKSLKNQNEFELQTVKINQKDCYAYSKYHSLAQEIPEGLVLPYKYKILFEFFQSLDTVVSMLFNRKEIISWNKVEHSVREITRKEFNVNHLSQIKHIFPDAYEYRQESNIVSFSESHKCSKYELTILPILKKEKTAEGANEKMTGGILIKRKHHFHLCLLNLTKKYHKEFLSSLQPPVEVEDDNLRRWHPRFSLDTVPNICLSSLPSPPDRDLFHCHSAKEVFEKAKCKLTKKAACALNKVSLLTTIDSGSDDNNNCNQSASLQNKCTLSSVKGISESLLEKIRKKEEAKNLKLMQRSKGAQEKWNQLKNLPNVCRVLRSLFVNEKKATLPMHYLCFKLSESCPLVSTPDAVDKHLRLLSTSLKSWFQVVELRGVEYGRLVGRQMQMCDVLCQLDACLKMVDSD